MNHHRVFIGWDPNEMRACAVAKFSAKVRSTVLLAIEQLTLLELQAKGLYRRPTETRERGYWDVISAAPMATQHAVSRFLVPSLCGFAGWALFVDGDVLVRRDLGELFALADPMCAVQVVQHRYEPTEDVKMAGHQQTRYARKNWSSVMLFNCGHPSNRQLTVDLVNTLPGRDLHRFCWLDDDEIGALPAVWNHLVGHSPADEDAAIVHFTEGIPDMPGYEHVAYSDEWYSMARACSYHLRRPEKAERIAV